MDPARLDSLRATRAGRIALDGFEYQRAFGVLRLAALALRRAVLGATEVPTWIRYEWGEDIDELADDGSVLLWQCKRGEGWRQPSKIVEVLEGFAPKFLWTPTAERGRLRFRLVTSDPDFAAAHDAASALPVDIEVKTRAAFLRMLSTAPGVHSDRARWQADANAFGAGPLFGSLWKQTAVLYVPGGAVVHDGVAVRFAEERAIYELAKGRRVRDAGQVSRVAADLQALLTTRPPGDADADGTIAVPSLPPEVIQPCDVDARLFVHGPAEPEISPFQVVDRTFLDLCRGRPTNAPFVARHPSWTDVVRGRDPSVRFFERAATGDVHRALSHALGSAAVGEGLLRIQFLTGAPGAGKSTLVLRVAAMLVDEGLCVAADARYRVHQGEDVRGFVESVHRLATGGRPVLLLTDDPLGAESGWPHLLTLLARVTSRVVVLAATPDFLFERHRGKFAGVHVLPSLVVETPSLDEREDFARLHPEAGLDPIACGGDDLLVLAMKAATGEQFDDLIRRIWMTLADQRQLSPDAVGHEIPWQVAAFLVVTFLQRADVACPELLLGAVLAARTDVGDYAAERIEALKLGSGWRIFRLVAADDQGHGASLRAMHALVAENAWRLRPVPAWNVGASVARASTGVPQLAAWLGRTLAAFKERVPDGAEDFLIAVAAAWSAGEVRGQLDTSRVAELSEALHLAGIWVPSPLKAELVRRAAAADPQSWIALLQLFRESALDPTRRAFPPRLTIGPIVDAADFGVSPGRVPLFAGALSNRPLDLAQMKGRLWRTLEDGTVDPAVLAWLVESSEAKDVIDRLAGIRDWLRYEADDARVRAAVLAWTTNFPSEATPEDVPDALAWVRAHPADTSVRAQLLKLLAATRSPHLGVILAETADLVEADSAARDLVSTALTAVASLDSAHSALISRWLSWAAEVLAENEGDRRVESIAISLPVPHATLNYFMRTNRVPAADHAAAIVALQATPEVCLRWYRSIDLPCPAVFG
ncbi:MAG: hypothetical protein Q8P41_29900 [Pseudomonadota bacterium]|nr:hypothetical protein [Pseudomonadota bacterium]